MEKSISPNYMNGYHTTILHEVAYEGQLEKTQLLLSHGADIDAIDEEYRSMPLGLAARTRRWAGAEWATPLAPGTKGRLCVPTCNSV
ncbi:MAG: ankyrin repeat domain-containing protein [Gemmatimonadetes bacterium]|nr:ankyrin repeat domain-containing protein [Gemmatimonadota bacterium]MBT6906929.1 ankyrin repeat domain-containing protein [Gemmatimonadota bacterium]MBT7422379.1 ankyrin repeat domain-containing protein [Gemmatimonadota bacterium]MBT7552432.1 ankyrin repeat domain-containing protein [Gemmatimonadota bacterium]